MVMADGSLVFSQARMDETLAALLPAVRFQTWEAIKRKRDSRILLGGFPVGPHWFHSDLISRSQYLTAARRADLVAATGGDMEAVFTNSEGDVIAVKTMENGLVPITGTLAHSILAAAELQESKTYKAALTHKAAMEAAANPAAYDFSTGWPTIHGE
jgi:hypothetical protein